MGRWWMAGVLIVGIVASGCRLRWFQSSVQPFFDSDEPVGDVSGRWAAVEDDDGGGFELVAAGDNGWQLRLWDSKAGSTAQAELTGGLVRFGHVGGALYWDLTADGPRAHDDVGQEHLLKLHSVARVRLGEDSMEVAFLNADWLSGALASGRVDLAHFRDGDDVVLTASTAELRAFLERDGQDPEAFETPLAFRRVPRADEELPRDR